MLNTPFFHLCLSIKNKDINDNYYNIITYHYMCIIVSINFQMLKKIFTKRSDFSRLLQ